jgi:arylsulfatase A-like enzyme
VLYILLDDVGLSAMEPFGGLIETPNIKRIAERELIYSNFHATAFCSPGKATVDGAGETWVDLEKEVVAAFARD